MKSVWKKNSNFGSVSISRTEMTIMVHWLKCPLRKVTNNFFFLFFLLKKIYTFRLIIHIVK